MQSSTPETGQLVSEEFIAKLPAIAGAILRHLLLIAGLLAGFGATYIFYFRPLFQARSRFDHWIDGQRCILDALCSGTFYVNHHLGLLLAISAVVLFALGYSARKLAPEQFAPQDPASPLFVRPLRGARLIGLLTGLFALAIVGFQAYQLLLQGTPPGVLLWFVGIVSLFLAALFWDWATDPHQVIRTLVGLTIAVGLVAILLGVIALFAHPLTGVGLLLVGGFIFVASIVFKSRSRSTLVPLDYFSILLFSILALVLGALRLNAWQYAFIGDEWGFYDLARGIIQRPDGQTTFTTWDSLGYHTIFSVQFQSFFMSFSGNDAAGWKISSVMAIVLSVPGVYLFAHWLAGRTAAFTAAGLFAGSHLLLSFAQVAYNNTQALVPLAWALGFFALAERKPGAMRYLLLGLALGMSFHVYSLARLAVIPIAILLLVMYADRFRQLIERGGLVALGGLVASAPMLLNLDNWESLLKATPVEHEVASPGSEALLSSVSNIIAGAQSFLYSEHNTHFVYGSHVDALTAVLLLAGLGYIFRFAWSQRKLAAWLAASLLFWAAVSGIQQYGFVSTTRMFILPVVYSVFAGVGAVALLKQLLPRTRYVQVAVATGLVLGVILLNQAHIVKASLPRSYWTDNDLLIRQLQESASDDGGGMPAYIVWTSPEPRLENLIARAYGIERQRFLSAEELLTLPGFCQASEGPAMALLFASHPRLTEMRSRIQACWPGATETAVKNGYGETRILQFTTPAGTTQLSLPSNRRLSWKDNRSSLAVPRNADIVVNQSNQVFVLDRENRQVWRYEQGHRRPKRIDLIADHPHGVTLSPEGALVISYESSERKLIWYDTNGTVLRQLAGDFGAVIKGIAIADNGDIYLADFHGSRVWHLSPQGDILHEYTGDGQISVPVSLGIGPNRSLWVLNAHTSGLIHLSADGSVLGRIEFQHANPEFPPRMVIDGRGNIFITVPEKQRVVQYSPSGEIQNIWGGFRQPTSFAMGPGGQMYVVDNELQELIVLSPADVQ